MVALSFVFYLAHFRRNIYDGIGQQDERVYQEKEQVEFHVLQNDLAKWWETKREASGWRSRERQILVTGGGPPRAGGHQQTSGVCEKVLI